LERSVLVSDILPRTPQLCDETPSDGEVRNKCITSGGSWSNWPGGLRNFISGWTYRIVALAIFIISGVSSHSSSPNLVKLVKFSCPYGYIESIHFSLRPWSENTNTKPVSSEISDLCEVSDLLLLIKYFAAQSKGIKVGVYFFGVRCVN